ncbi:hypothetical protein [Phenylobacterium sp.]|jgi:hypothetical protein|uniref:hypothetical protein n=1 Tax=Phenylobacterium sp. TaxID=1871053 RepID=UPI002E37F6F7|nr:hypothetical protein [Phenylobacterium sp.]HEX4708969.1 hypothetical protein [Phenylobacterium sp.]
MSAHPRQIRLGAFLQATGHHVAAWLHPESQADAGLNLAHPKALAQEAERGKFEILPRRSYTETGARLFIVD